MDKVTPKDVFQANRDRVAPLLAKRKAEGIGHMIGGKTVCRPLVSAWPDVPGWAGGSAEPSGEVAELGSTGGDFR